MAVIKNPTAALESEYIVSSASFSGRISDLEAGGEAFPLGNQTPSSVTNAASSAGTRVSSSREDHSHFHGYLQGGGLHQAATTVSGGFMSPTQVSQQNALTNATSSYALSAALDAFTGSYAVTSASFNTRINNLTASVAFHSAAYLDTSASFNLRINNLTASVAAHSATFVSISSTLVAASSAFATVSSSFVIVSSSFQGRISTLEQGASVGTSFVTTASFDAFTGSYTQASTSFAAVSSSFITVSASFNGRINTLTASVNTITSSFNAFTASYVMASASFAGQVAVLENASSSFESRTNTLVAASSAFAAVSASYVVTSASLANRINSVTASLSDVSSSFNLRINNLTASVNTVTASFNAFTASYGVTSASFSTRISDLEAGGGGGGGGFPLGSQTPQAVVNNGSASPGIRVSSSREDHTHPHGNLLGDDLHAVATTASNGFFSASDKQVLNDFTASIPFFSAAFVTTSASLIVASSSFSSRLTSLETVSSSFVTVSASLQSRVSNLENASSSFETRINNLASATAAHSATFTSFSTSMLTASSSFSLRINNITSSITFHSASYINTSASFNSRINQLTASMISVKSFGAVGDGVTDDTTALQTAIDTMKVVGGRLYFPTGIYMFTHLNMTNINTTFQPSLMLTLCGEGPAASTLQQTTGAGGVCIDISNSNWLRFENMGLFCGANTDIGVLATRFTTGGGNCNFHVFTDFWIRGSANLASFCGIGAESVYVDRCWIDGGELCVVYLGATNSIGAASAYGTIQESVSNIDIHFTNTRISTAVGGGNPIRLCDGTGVDFHNCATYHSNEANGDFVAHVLVETPDFNDSQWLTVFRSHLFEGNGDCVVFRQNAGQAAVYTNFQIINSWCTRNGYNWVSTSGSNVVHGNFLFEGNTGAFPIILQEVERSRIIHYESGSSIIISGNLNGCIVKAASGRASFNNVLCSDVEYFSTFVDEAKNYSQFGGNLGKGARFIRYVPTSVAPLAGQFDAGVIAVASPSGSGWDPSNIGGLLPYPTFWDGVQWQPMTPATASFAIASASFQSRITTLENASSSFETKINNLTTAIAAHSATFTSTSSSLVSASASFASRIDTEVSARSTADGNILSAMGFHSASYLLLSASYLNASASHETRLNTLTAASSAFAAVSASSVVASASFGSRLTLLEVASSSFVTVSASFQGRITTIENAGDTGTPLGTEDPQPVFTMSLSGVSLSASRADHQHFHGYQPGGGLHETATSLSAGFMSAPDKVRIDAIVAATASYANASQMALFSATFINASSAFATVSSSYVTTSASFQSRITTLESPVTFTAVSSALAAATKEVGFNAQSIRNIASASVETLRVGGSGSGRAFFRSEAADTTAPTQFTSDDFVIGLTGSIGDDSGAIFMRYIPGVNIALIGALSPSLAWRTIFFGAHHTVFQNSFGGSAISFDGCNNQNMLRFRNDGGIVWADGSDATGTPWAGLVAPSSSVVIATDGAGGLATFRAATALSASDVITKGVFDIVSASFVTVSSSFETRISNLSTATAAHSATFVSISSTLVAASSAFAAQSASSVTTSASFNLRINNITASIAFHSAAYLDTSASFDLRINNIPSVTQLQSRDIPLIFGDGVNVVTAQTASLFVPYNCTVTGWQLIADAAGSIVIDVKKTSYANYPASFASIAGSEKPTLSSVQKNEDLTLSTWTDTTLQKGEILGFMIEGTPTTVKRVTLRVIVTLDLT